MADNSDNAIDVKGLYKVYKSSSLGQKIALDHIDLSIPKGSFFGLLGPNGAGKSTLINIMAGLVNKTSGNVSISGFDIDENFKAAKQSIGIVPQELFLDPFFPPFEALENTAGYYGVPKNRRRTYEIIDALGLADKAYSQARSLSGGMKRRLLIAKALVHSPKVLVLDEPTAGVDVELRSQLWDYVQQLNEQGTTILLTTHYLEEAEKLCNYIAVIDKGKVIVDDTKANVMKIIESKKMIITTDKVLTKVPQPLHALDAILLSENRIEIGYNPKDISAEEIIGACQKAKLTIVDIATQEADLEEIFRSITQS